MQLVAKYGCNANLTMCVSLGVCVRLVECLIWLTVQSTDTRRNWIGFPLAHECNIYLKYSMILLHCCALLKAKCCFFCWVAGNGGGVMRNNGRRAMPGGPRLRCRCVLEPKKKSMLRQSANTAAEHGFCAPLAVIAADAAAAAAAVVAFSSILSLRCRLLRSSH